MLQISYMLMYCGKQSIQCLLYEDTCVPGMAVGWSVEWTSHLLPMDVPLPPLMDETGVRMCEAAYCLGCAVPVRERDVDLY